MLTTQFISEADIGERAWIDFDPSVLADGAVSSFLDKSGSTPATQATGGAQPTMSAAGGGIVFSGGVQKFLNFPTITDPKYHHWFMVVAKLDYTSTSASSGNLCSVNGFAVGDGRAPFFGFGKSGANTISAQWAGNSPFSTLTLTGPSDNGFHIWISRLDANGVHYFSMDGGTESVDTTGLPILPKSVSNGLGQIGDNNNSTINWTLNRYIIGQNILSADDVARIAAGFLWKMGLQANLPANSPYATRQPGSKGFWPTPYPYITQAQFQALEGSTPNSVSGWWQSPSLTQYYGTSSSALIAGFTTDFFEDFTSASVLGTELTNPGPATVFGPTIDTTGGSEILRMPGQTPTGIYNVTNSELQITMQQVTPGLGNTWYSGAITSVNLAGRGYTFDPSKAPFYAGMRARITNGNGFGAWAAFWLKPLEVFFNATTPYFEVDVVETYGSTSTFIHCSLHHWSGARNYQNRGTSANSDYNSKTSNSAGNGTPYDGQYHEFGWLIDKRLGYMVYMFDMFELVRCPIPASLFQPTFFIADMAMLTSELSQALGTYVLGIDYIRVLKGKPY